MQATLEALNLTISVIIITIMTGSVLVFQEQKAPEKNFSKEVSPMEWIIIRDIYVFTRSAAS